MAVHYVVAGGGIAGVTCAEQLSELDPDAKITLLSASKLIKAATNFRKVGRTLEDFNVQETSSNILVRKCPNVTIMHQAITGVSHEDHLVYLINGESLKYDKLCICTGALPKIVSIGNRWVLGVRDTESVEDLISKVCNARRVVIIGNGGIAMELVFELKGREVIWAIKDTSIGTTYFDEGAAKFFLSELVHGTSVDKEGGALDSIIKTKPVKRIKYMLESTDPKGSSVGGGQLTEAACVKRDYHAMGSALGPDWFSELKIEAKQTSRNIHIDYGCEVSAIYSLEEFKGKKLKETVPKGVTKQDIVECQWPVYVEFTNGTLYGCDLVVSATGVTPNVESVHSTDKFNLAEDGGLLVDCEMRTNLNDIYAAGDVCSVNWIDHTFLWFQMRLWTQARQMGAYAGKCMVAHHNVVLLGRYNAQSLSSDYQLLLRCTPGREYIKVVMKDGRMIGAILIGDTDLEETFENLILNQLDLSRFGENLLNPDIDIEDFFD